MSLSTNIRQFRKDNGISQEFMAEQLCMSQPTYSRLEQQEHICTKRLAQIARALVTTPETLLNYPAPNEQKPTDGSVSSDSMQALLTERDALIQQQADELAVLRQRLHNPPPRQAS